MVWRVSREDFLTTLEQLTPGLSPSEDVEQGSCFAFDGKRVFTFNDEIACWHRSPLKIEGAIEAKPLLEHLRKMSEEEIQVSLEDNELRIKGKRRNAGFRMEDDVTLPIESVERPQSWETLHENFCNAIQMVASSVAKDAERDGFDMTCVHIDRKWVEASNRLQAIRYKIKSGIQSSILVRGDSIRHIVSMGMVEFAETESWIHFRNPQKLIISCRRFSEDYPDLTPFMEAEGESVKLSGRMAGAAEAAANFTNTNLEDNQIEVSLRRGKMIVSGNGPHGWMREPIKIRYNGPKLKFLVVPSMFQEIVKQHRSCLISERRLVVEGDRWQFAACLNPPDDESVSDSDSSD